MDRFEHTDVIVYGDYDLTHAHEIGDVYWTLELLDRFHVPYEYINVSNSLDDWEHTQKLGYRSYPVVEVSDFRHFNGHRPDLIREVAEMYGEVPTDVDEDKDLTNKDNMDISEMDWEETN